MKPPLVSQGHWFLFAVWLIAGSAGVVAALQPGATREVVMVVVLAVTFSISIGGWLVDRVRGVSRPGPPRPRFGVYVGTAVVVLAVWWILNWLIAPGLDGGAVGTAAHFIWFISGLLLTDLIAQAVDRRVPPDEPRLAGTSHVR